MNDYDIKNKLLNAGFAVEFINTISAKVQNSHFKRSLPVVAKVSMLKIDTDLCIRNM